MSYYFLFKILSNSMYPLIKINDIILIKKIEFDFLNNHDVVAVKDYERIIIHRIIKKSHFKGITKGDNNEYIDNKYLTSTNLIGKAYFILRDNKLLDIYNKDKVYLLKTDKEHHYCEIDNINLVFNMQFTQCFIKNIE